MKKLLKLTKSQLSKLVNHPSDGLMIYFRTEYKKNPIEAYEYWMTTKNINFYN